MLTHKFTGRVCKRGRPYSSQGAKPAVEVAWLEVKGWLVWGRLAPSAQLAVHCLLPLIRLSSPYAQAAFPHRTWPPPAFHVMLAPPCSCSHPTALSHTVPGTRHRVPEALEGLRWVQSSHCFSHFPLHKPALPSPEAYTCHYASWGSLHSCD